MPASQAKTLSSIWLPVGLLALLVAFTFFSDSLAGEREGSDDRAVELAESLGAEPVASLPFEPSESAEKWLFVLQGALGIGLLTLAMRHRNAGSSSSAAQESKN